MPPAPVPVPAPIKVPQVFAQALELHKQGRLTEAEQFIPRSSLTGPIISTLCKCSA